VIIALAPFALGLVSLAGLTFFPTRTRETLRSWRAYLPIACFSYLGVLFWFFTVPGFRFGMHYLIYSLLMVFAAAASPFAGILRFFSRFIPPAVAVLIAIYLSLTFYLSIDQRTLDRRWLLPANYVNLPTEPCAYHGFSIHCATQYQQCGYEPFPCTPAGNPFVEMRGNSFADGFRIKAP
jgi:hypothetical protein